MNEFLGQIAALTTACCWAFTSIFFTIGGQRVGSVTVNRVRLLFALAFLAITHLIMFGKIFPFDAGADHWLWLGLSGIIGLVVGDAMLFQAFVVIGTRLPILMMSLVPVISTVEAWVFLDERLSAVEILGILITVCGIAWVVADKNRDRTLIGGKRLALGILLGFGGAVGQATGLLASKLGLANDFPALSGNLIRMFVAASVMWLLTLIMGKARVTVSRLKDRVALRAIIGGAAFGPFIGVWMSLVAIKLARIGIASTLMALAPILTIPLVYWFFKEKVSIHAILGTIVAIAGVAVLFLA
jgi:drug/metabolite transporter (DMT)-like permease